MIMSDERIAECAANNDDLLMKAEQHIQKLTCELKEKEAEKAHYIKENDFLKEALRRLIGA